MNKYEKWFEIAWDKLNEDFRNGDFRPQMESDIVCHLYCKLLQTKQDIKKLKRRHVTLTDHKFSHAGRRRHVDLVIGSWGEKRGFAPRLAVEIKETGTELKELGKKFSIDNVENRVRKDIEKLEEFCPMDVKKYVIFFFRNAPPISSNYEKELDNIKQKYKDITFKWGPL